MTPKARAALLLIQSGQRSAVTRQMIDRLAAGRLIDFDLDAGGWVLTRAGVDALEEGE